jgi:hypothetical protein
MPNGKLMSASSSRRAAQRLVIYTRDCQVGSSAGQGFRSRHVVLRLLARMCCVLMNECLDYNSSGLILLSVHVCRPTQKDAAGSGEATCSKSKNVMCSTVHRAHCTHVAFLQAWIRPCLRHVSPAAGATQAVCQHLKPVLALVGGVWVGRSRAAFCRALSTPDGNRESPEG